VPSPAWINCARSETDTRETVTSETLLRAAVVTQVDSDAVVMG